MSPSGACKACNEAPYKNEFAVPYMPAGNLHVGRTAPSMWMSLHHSCPLFKVVGSCAVPTRAQEARGYESEGSGYRSGTYF